MHPHRCYSRKMRRVTVVSLCGYRDREEQFSINLLRLGCSDPKWNRMCAEKTLVQPLGIQNIVKDENMVTS